MVETELATGLITKIIGIVLGVSALFAFTQSGENSYTFEVGENLMMVLLTLIFGYVGVKTLEHKSRAVDGALK